LTHSYAKVAPEATAAVDTAITSRRSVRGFLPKPVPRDIIEDILKVASRAPSGSNIQPWKVTVLTGAPLRELTKLALAAHHAAPRNGVYDREWEYYPRTWTSPYVDRRRKLGWEMYRLAGIEKGDKERMHAQHGRNFDFFDAPVGLIFTLDRILEVGSWIDCGGFMQSVMIAARARGIDTCPQAAFGDYYKVVTDFIGAPESETLVCGMAMGYADPEVPVNALVTEREPVAGFTRFME
jgi:nitroreductase